MRFNVRPIRRGAVAVGGVLALMVVMLGAPATASASTSEIGPKSAPMVAPDPICTNADGDVQPACQDFAIGKVTANPSLNVRHAPTTYSVRIYALSKGSTVFIECKVPGPYVDGNRYWYKLADGGFATARYIDNVDFVPPWCGTARGYYGTVIRPTLHIRTGPNTGNAIIESRTSGAEVMIQCKVNSQSIDGNTLWYWVEKPGRDGWMAARYVRIFGLENPPICGPR